MQTDKIYDYAIIGGGCSGLSLALKLIKLNKKIIIIENKKNYLMNDKTWSFWNTYKTIFEKIIFNKYSKWTICSDKKNYQTKKSKYKYLTIRSIDFYNYCLDIINKNKNIDIIFSCKVNSLIEKKKYVEITSNKKKILSKLIFNSTINNNSKCELWQHFLGYKIKFENNIVDKDNCTLMDFDYCNKDLINFIYILPYDKKNLLIESTFYSENIFNKKIYRDNLELYIKNKFPKKKYLIIDEEYGKIPLKKYNEVQKTKRILSIGTISGSIRPSTGYSFLSIQKQTDSIIKYIEKNSNFYKFKYRHYNPINEWMDSIFLKIIINKPLEFKKIILKMFTNTNGNDVIKFLSSEDNIYDKIKIILRLPKLIFIMALFK